MESEQLYFAINEATGQGVSFTRSERERHVYIVGKSGSGKTTTLFNMAMEDIQAGEGVTVIDPHGDLAEMLVDCIPPDRTNQVCYLNVTDTDRPVGFNPLAAVPPERRALAASGIVSAFRHLWIDSWGARTEYLLSHGVRALLDTAHTSLIDLPRVYTDDQFRRRLVALSADPATTAFWKNEFAKYAPAYRNEVIAPILNKAGQFTASPNLRLILGQRSPKFSLEHAMNGRGIVIANLSKGRIGEQATNALGSLLISHIQLAAMARSCLRPECRVPHFIHVDEFQSFTTDAFASIFSESRKFAAYFCLANQFTEQIPQVVRSAVLGNAGSLIVFCVAAVDAELLAPEFELPASALTQQPPFSAWIRRGTFENAKVRASPRLYPLKGRRSVVVAQSRRHFGRPAGTIGDSATFD
jgi:Type IV secretion-system coupling protein DNA-binding domain